MSIRSTCPKCAKVLSVPDEMSGHKVRCKACGGAFTVAEQLVTEAAPAAEDDEALAEAVARTARDADDESDPRSKPECKSVFYPWYYRFLAVYAWMLIVAGALAGVSQGGMLGLILFAGNGPGNAKDIAVGAVGGSVGATIGAVIGAIVGALPAAFVLVAVDIGRRLRDLAAKK